MFTSIYSLGKVTGAEIVLGGCIVCLLLTFLISLAIKSNRGKNLPRTLFGIAISALLCDLMFFLMLFPNGEYVNYGIGSAYGMSLYPLALTVGGTTVSCINRIRSKSYDN